ncbi:hypothetical protein SDC9_111850 [bioreactor metagenome]|uniref:Septum site-determining protein DivIVA n=1 Tax=bioreactor metagenome TaxID=1076179 RepID=A0A645BIQ2_9ZZZZ|nr:DivIVA domain-containing protein [Oscillospiraceae bacterium]
MISPHDLKKKTFQKAVRGYNSVEVDEYIEYLIDSYTELYRENAELEKKLHILGSKYDELAGDEKSIRSAIIKAQKLSETIIDNAKKEADAVIAGISGRCDSVITEAAKKVEDEREALKTLRTSAQDFKEKLCDGYMQHIKFIQALEIGNPDKADEDIPSSDELYKIAAMDVSKEKDPKVGGDFISVKCEKPAADDNTGETK